MDAEMLKNILIDIKNDDRYKHGIIFKIGGKNTSISVRDHIKDLETNLNIISEKFNISNEEYWAIMFLIHTHDTMKMHAIPNSKIHDKFSHCSLAKDFASEFCKDEDLLSMIHYHEEPFSLYRGKVKDGKNVDKRLENLFSAIKNWRIFLIFLIVDNCVNGYSRDPIIWIIEKANKRFSTDIDKKWIIF